MYLLCAKDERGRLVGQLDLGATRQTIGRSDTADLLLDGKGVSRTHASIYTRDGVIYLRDEASANGIKVDGEVIAGSAVIDIDSLITISSFQLTVKKREVSGDRPADSAHPSVEAAGAINLDTMLEARPGAARILADSGLYLTLDRRSMRSRLRSLAKKKTYFRHRKFRLNKALVSVGRDFSCDLRLDDASISRQHAQLRLNPGDRPLTVLDLRSANGTYVEGKRIKRIDVEAGARIRFGDISFRLLDANARPKTTGIKTGHRWKMIVGLVVFVAMVLVVTKLIGRDEPWGDDKRNSGDPLRTQLADQSADVIARTERLFSQKKWEEGLVQLNAFLRADPLHDRARRLREYGSRQQGIKNALGKARSAISRGGRSDLIQARTLLEGIPDGSSYETEARGLKQDVTGSLADVHRSTGLAYCRARKFRECYRELCSYFGVRPSSESSERTRALQDKMLAIEKRLVKSDLPRCLSAPYRKKNQRTERSGDALQAIEKRYPWQPLRNAVDMYAEGRIHKALDQASRLNRHRDFEHNRRAVKKFRSEIGLIRGKYQEGLVFFRRRDVLRAHKIWRSVLRADEKVVPLSVDSFYRREIIGSLTGLYYQMGYDLFQMKRFPGAFKYWHAGFLLAPEDPKLHDGLARLEREAKRLIADGKSLAEDEDRQRDAMMNFDRARRLIMDGRPLKRAVEEAIKAISDRQ